MGSVMNGTRGAKGEFAISINQCSWSVVSMNAAAQDLFELQDLIAATAQRESEKSFHYTYEWTEDLLSKVLDAYARNPEMFVQHGNWPTYRLALGPMESRGRRNYMERTITPKSLTNFGLVFEAHGLCLNLSIGDVLTHAVHPAERLKKMRAKVAAPVPGGYPGIDQLFLEQDEKSLEEDIATFEADPDGEDFVEVTYSDWFLYKAVP